MRKRQQGFIYIPMLVEWLLGHQAIAAAAAVYFGAGAAGIDLTDKAIHLYRDATTPQAQVAPAQPVKKEEDLKKEVPQ